MVKNTSTGTVTDLDGNYTLEVPDVDAVLVFSFLGYRTTEVPVQGRSRIDVVLEEDIQELQEVVVVGYGVQKKSVVTGAIAKVKAEELENMPLTRIEQSLQGRTSGVLVTNTSGQPGAGAVVRIRGTTTINNSDPLYVVDGVPIGGGIDYLAQGDIESIEVLKDAASAAVYGARAANGVILVTTKKGKQGQARLNYNTYYGVQNPWRKLSLLNAREYAILMNESFAAAGDDIPFPDPDALGEGTDWQDEVFHYNAPISNHELSLTAGNEQSSYFASFSYLDQEGIVSQSDSRYQRLTARINSTHKVGSRFNFGQTLSYTRTRGVSVAENTEFGSPLSRAINIDPITPVYETDPDELADPRYANNWDALVRDDQGRIFAISKYVTSEIVNPVAALLVQQGYGWSDKIVGNVFAEYELLDGLKLRSSVGADIAFWGGESFTPIHHLNASNFATQTSYNRGQNRGLYLILENTISYQKVFGAHDLAVVAGTSAERNRGQGQSGTLTDLPVDNIDDASLSLPAAPDNQFFWGYEYETRLASYFGRVNYNYAQKYLLSVVLRVDGSSKFGTNNKFGFFPSVSAGWVISEEPFWAASSPVKFLKLRGSWGVNGNNQIGDFLYASTVGGGRYYTFGVGDVLTDGVSPNAIANPDLRWEQTTQTNFGFDARLFRNWSLTFDYYRKETTDMLLGVEVPGYVGNVGPVGNIASMFNEGLGLEVGFDKQVGEWNLSLSANGSHVRNEVTFLTNEKTFLPGQRFGPQGLEITRTTVGYPIGHF
ncbi:MAG: SusC/RagA family TonB-linked outer membrane protein, partial [Bacteroidetes bacterium]